MIRFLEEFDEIEAKAKFWIVCCEYCLDYGFDSCKMVFSSESNVFKS